MRRKQIVEEITLDHIQEVHDVILQSYAVLEAATIALYHINEEPDPAKKTTVISFAIDKVASDLEKLSDEMQEYIERME